MGSSLNQLLVREDSAGLKWLHSDATCSTTAVTGVSGQVLERYEYTPFGQVTFTDANSQVIVDAQGQAISESAIENPYLFLARRLDSTGHYYFRERYYDPARGRFLERDSKNDELNLGNLYTFASNNPLTYTDPWGMSGQAGGNGFYKQAGKLGWAFLKGIGKGLWNTVTGLFSMPNLPSWSSIKSLISQLWNDPSGMFKKMFKYLRAKSAEEWAEMAGEMFVDLIISLLTGGAGLGKIAAKLGKKAMGLLVKGLSKINRAAKRAGIRVKIGGKCIYNACFVAGTLVLLGNGDHKAIEDITVGDRVVTKQLEKTVEQEPEINDSWVVISIRIPSKAGNANEEGQATLLRSKEWFEKHYNREKNAVWLQFGETNTIGWYPVLSTKKASKPKAGKGRLVLSTINRVVSNVYELKIVGQSETIKGTGNHKFWSEDRQDWVPLCALKLGERLLLKSAVKAHVEWVKRVAGKFRVYNFEVQGVHNYFVGSDPLLVHNDNDCLLLGDGEKSKRLYKGLSKKQTKDYVVGGPENVFKPEKFAPVEEGAKTKIPGADFATVDMVSRQYAQVKGGSGLVVEVPKDTWNNMVKRKQIVPDPNMIQGKAVTVKNEGLERLVKESSFEHFLHTDEKFLKHFGFPPVPDYDF